jgi:hypothetical protein
MTWFTPSSDTVRESARALRKNYNWPILSRIFFGDRRAEMRCIISGAPAWRTVRIRTGERRGETRRFLSLEFNHIRQYWDGPGAGAGRSIDSTGSPSGFYRDRELDRGDERAKRILLEFMAVIPVDKVQHAAITADSQLGHITLRDYTRDEWPWAIRNSRNFNEICREFGIRGVGYRNFRDHLSDITAPPLNSRLTYTESGWFKWT